MRKFALAVRPKSAFGISEFEVFSEFGKLTHLSEFGTRKTTEFGNGMPRLSCLCLARNTRLSPREINQSTEIPLAIRREQQYPPPPAPPAILIKTPVCSERTNGSVSTQIGDFEPRSEHYTIVYFR